jgi:hypothetical protein
MFTLKMKYPCHSEDGSIGKGTGSVAECPPSVLAPPIQTVSPFRCGQREGIPLLLPRTVFLLFVLRTWIFHFHRTGCYMLMFNDFENRIPAIRSGDSGTAEAILKI